MKAESTIDELFLLKAIAQKTAEMRMRQKKYFQSKLKYDLISSKKAEDEVDRLLNELFNSQMTLNI